MRRTCIAPAIGVMVVLLAGCQNNDMSKGEMDKAKQSKFDDAARAKMAEGMKQGAAAAHSQQQEWANKNPSELARINAERAKMGRPPIGGG